VAVVLGAVAAMASERDAVEAWIEKRLAGGPLPLISREIEALSLADAYAIQAELENRQVEAGDAKAGYKLAFTSPESQRRFGVDGPARGFLLRSMALRDDGRVELRPGARVFAEAEIAFVIGRRIDPVPSDPARLVPHVRAVHPALELATLRFAPDLQPRLVDVVADGAGAWRFALGPGRDPAGLDLSRLEAVLEREGVILGRGSGADALGDPWRALLWVANDLVRNGRALEPGDVVLSGALGPAQPLDAGGGRLRARVGALGGVEVQVAAQAPGTERAP
jgi:2-keto-4-pentenoate hydratase